ncbi:hypothetical protein BN1708_010422 [Verticillium longisporum]|uniref:Uncharacterized protein n=1 Tax=Verticillium longisporum TaxID=100787 RepID=A0A0G4KRA3_VERLO|nr:hypothetical protein BN1708_010422 [Verticillium longisporum]
MSATLASPITYEPDSIAIYHATLRAVRYDLRQTEHITDSRASTGHLASLSALLPLVEEVDETNLADLCLTAPCLRETILPDESSVDLVNSCSQDVTTKDLHILAEDASTYSSRVTKDFELPLLPSNHDQDFKDFLKKYSPGSRPNPIHTSILPREPVDEHKDESMTFPRKAYATLAQLEEQLINETIEPDVCDTTCISEALKNYDEENLSLSTIMSEISILQVRMTFLSSSCTNRSEKGSNCMPSPLLLPLEDVEHLQPPIFEQPNPDNFVPLDTVSLIEEDLTTETHAALHVASPPETPVIHLSSTPKEPDILSFTPPSYVKMCDVMFEKPTVAELSSSVHSSVDADQAPTTLDAFAIKSDPIHLLHFSDATILDEPQENNSRTQMYPKGLASQSHHPTGQVQQQLGQNKPTILDSTILLPDPKLDFSIPHPSRASNGCSKSMFKSVRHDWKTYPDAWPQGLRRERQLRWTPFSLKDAELNVLKASLIVRTN